MAQPFIGEIRMFSFGFAPRGWALCNGQTLAIAQNQALFAILGTTYGGNGVTTFLLPNLQTRTPVHYGSEIPIGGVGGEQNHTLTVNETAAHTHLVNASVGAPNSGSPTDSYLTVVPNNTLYSPPNTRDSAMLPFAPSGGGGQPHNNMQPYTVVSFCIALVGIFPSRN